MPRYVIPLVSFVALVGVLAAVLSKDYWLTSASSSVGKSAPSFALPRLKQPEQQLELSDLNGRVAILNVWATWCVPCRQEHGMLLTMARSGEAPIYGLNYKDNRDLAIRWLEELGDPFVATGYDAQGEVAHKLGVRAVPETYVLDSRGVVVYHRVGPISPEVWQNEMLPVLKRARITQQDSDKNG